MFATVKYKICIRYVVFHHRFSYPYRQKKRVLQYRIYARIIFFTFRLKRKSNTTVIWKTVYSISVKIETHIEFLWNISISRRVSTIYISNEIILYNMYIYILSWFNRLFIAKGNLNGYGELLSDCFDYINACLLVLMFCLNRYLHSGMFKLTYLWNILNGFCNKFKSSIFSFENPKLHIRRKRRKNIKNITKSLKFVLYILIEISN